VTAPVKPLLVLLPSTDGTGALFFALAKALSPYADLKIIAYPQSGDQSYAALGARILDSLPTERDYVLLGESFGGPLALWLAVHAPKPPQKLILGASFAASPFCAFGRMVLPLIGIGQWLPLWAWQIRLILFNGACKEMANQVHEAVKPVDRRTLLARVRVVLNCDMSPLLPRITQPVLHIHAAKDRLLPGFLPRHLSALPNIRTVSLALPHMIFQCAPERVVHEVLLPFLHEA
jgi:pimeloyl-[acyl-carrier protein] methyl ester esterase